MCSITLTVVTLIGRIVHSRRSPLTSRTSSKRRALRNLLLLVAVISFFLISLLPASVHAQCRIVVISKSRQPLQPPISEVTRILGSNRRSAQIDTIPINLEIGDELVGNQEDLKVSVRSVKGQWYTMYGKFRARLMQATERECYFDFSGEKDSTIMVYASGPSRLRSGEIKMGAEKTIYGITETANGTEFQVFNAPVKVSGPGLEEVLSGGQKLVTKSGSTPAIMELTKEDTRLAALRLASLAVSQMLQIAKACPLCMHKVDYDAAYRELSKLLEGVFQSPDDKVKVRALDEALKRYRVLDSDVKSYVLKAGEKRTVPVGFTNGCKDPIKVKATLSNSTFSRLISPADAIAQPEIRIWWQIVIDATKLPPGTYTIEVAFVCVDCSKGCTMTMPFEQIIFVVQ